MLSRFVMVNVLLLVTACVVAARADQNAEKLDPLFSELAAAQNAVTVIVIEQEIWKTWLESGDEDVDRELEAGISAMTGGRLDDAIRHFSTVTEMAPDFAEGWNKRATAYYLNDEPVKSMQDIQRTLELEPRHFGAISGMGLIFLQQGNELAALQAFEEVLKIHPSTPEANQHVRELRKKLEGQGI